MVEIHKGRADSFGFLESAWAKCVQEGDPQGELYSYEWVRAWMSTFGQVPPWTGEFWMVTIADSDQAIVAILPLALRVQKGVRFLCLAGYHQPSRSFPCIESRVSADVFREAFVQLERSRGWDILRLGALDEDVPKHRSLIAGMAQASAARTIVLAHGRTIVNSTILTQANWEQNSSVKKIRYYVNRWNRNEGAEIRHWRGFESDAELQQVLADLGAVERASWLGSEGGDLRFDTSTDRSFWGQVIPRALAPDELLDVWIAYLKGTPVAFRFVIRSGATSYLIANQYDQAYAKFSLGWVLYLASVEPARRSGVTKIDMAPGDAHYKSQLGGEEAGLHSSALLLHPGIRGYCLKILLQGVQRARPFLATKKWGRRWAAKLEI